MYTTVVFSLLQDGCSYVSSVNLSRKIHYAASRCSVHTTWSSLPYMLNNRESMKWGEISSKKVPICHSSLQIFISETYSLASSQVVILDWRRLRSSTTWPLMSSCVWLYSWSIGLSCSSVLMLHLSLPWSMGKLLICPKLHCTKIYEPYSTDNNSPFFQSHYEIGSWWNNVEGWGALLSVLQQICSGLLWSGGYTCRDCKAKETFIPAVIKMRHLYLKQHSVVICMNVRQHCILSVHRSIDHSRDYLDLMVHLVPLSDTSHQLLIQSTQSFQCQLRLIQALYTIVNTELNHQRTFISSNIHDFHRYVHIFIWICTPHAVATSLIGYIKLYVIMW